MSYKDAYQDDQGFDADEIIEETMQEIYDSVAGDEEEGPDSESDKETEEVAEEAQEEHAGERPEEAGSDTAVSDDEPVSGEHEEAVAESSAGEEPAQEVPGVYDAVPEEDGPKKKVHRRGRRHRHGKHEYKHEPSEDELAERKQRRTRRNIVIGCILGALVLIYAGFAFYFSSHFYFHTKINDVDFSMKSAADVQKQMKQQVDDYTLALKKQDNTSEDIKGTDIDLTYVSGDEVDKLLKDQNPLLWIRSLWHTSKVEASIGVKYDEDKLNAKIDSLDILKEESQTAPVNAHPEYKDGQFRVVDEVYGTQVNKDILVKTVKLAINGFKTEINLKSSGCYTEPKFNKHSTEVVNACNTMNGYLKTNVTYEFGSATENVAADKISAWLKTDDNMNITFDQAAIRAYIDSLGEKYDTRGKTITFHTSSGRDVQVDGGSFGYRINRDEETAALIENIKKGETVSKEPVYSSKGKSRDGNGIGNTYAEVDLTNQHMYYVKDGQVVLETAVVTGNPNKGNATPAGLYFLNYKQKDRVLRGQIQANGKPAYETPVKYWMPFNGGVGFHDASWQPTFGGTRYQTHGSHGCVNMPPAKAAELYNLINSGDPVICYK